MVALATVVQPVAGGGQRGGRCRADMDVTDVLTMLSSPEGRTL